MTRLHFVKKAKKTYKGTGIKKGDSYYWWKFAFQPKRMSKTKPPRSQYMTRSEFVGSMMDLEDQFNEGLGTTVDEVVSGLEELINEVENLKDVEQEKADSMEQAFPNGCPALEIVQERIENCESTISNLQSAVDSLSDESTEEDIEAALADVTWEY